MTLIVDFAFLLLAAGGGAVAAALVLWLRGRPVAAAEADAGESFAHETLGRLQDLTRKVAAQLDQHAECVQEINAQLASQSDNDESAVLSAVSQLIDANRRMQRQIDSAEERLKTQAEQIESHAVEARTDPLTKVANRRALDDELARCVADFQQLGAPTTVMLIDVDHFKKFNDTHGHQAGDDVLRTVATTIRQSTSEVGLVARYGGEEFAVVFAGLTSEAAIPYAERARQLIGESIVRVGGREFRVTASAGVTMTIKGDAAETLVQRADQALYTAKKNGRNCAYQSDGRTFSRIELARLAGRSGRTSQSQAGKIGDEWLYEEDATEFQRREEIPNVAGRPAFFDDLIRRLVQVHRGGAPLGLLMVQVDGFDRTVSEYGSAAGEVVLRITAQFINAVMRDIDQVARLSEDTFALLLPGTVLPDGVAIAERLRQSIERCRLPRRAGVSWITISVGVVEGSESDDLRSILQRGREALARAVSQGRNCVMTCESLQAAAAE